MDSRSWLLVRAGSSSCALPFASVAEVLRPLPLRPVADGPAALAGLAVLRGQATPVLDLRRLLGEAATPARRWVRLSSERPVALAVDEVAGLVAPDAGWRAEPLLARCGEGTLDELGRLDDRILLLLDPARLVALVPPSQEPSG